MNKREDQMRAVTMHTGFIPTADGSVLIEVGHTRLICTAMIEEAVPVFREGSGLGWVSAEYAMLPASTQTRKKRDRERTDGRSVEIQRLIGRSLRSVVDMSSLKERTIWLDCDVIQADGGTRTAGITGAFVALALAVEGMLVDGRLQKCPLRDYVSAVGCGIVDGQPVLDLCYAQDSKAEVDMNFVMSGSGDLIEVQGTGEKRPFTRREMHVLMELAAYGTSVLCARQKEALGKMAAQIGVGV
jgi:ribonuclease PH